MFIPKLSSNLDWQKEVISSLWPNMDLVSYLLMNSIRNAIVWLIQIWHSLVLPRKKNSLSHLKSSKWKKKRKSHLRLNKIKSLKRKYKKRIKNKRKMNQRTKILRKNHKFSNQKTNNHKINKQKTKNLKIRNQRTKNQKRNN